MQSIIQGAEAYEKHPFPSVPSPSSQYTFSSLPKGLHRCEQVPPPHPYLEPKFVVLRPLSASNALKSGVLPHVHFNILEPQKMRCFS